MILRSPSRSTQVLAILLVVIVSVSCDSRGVTLPYLAQIETIYPNMPGLEIRATAGGGGELEIINRTAQEVMLLNEQGHPYVRLVSDGVYELIGTTWVKTKDAPVYYCHDPRIVYDGPAPVARAPQVMKRWTITGQIGSQIFAVSGQTVYTPDRIPGLSIIWPITGTILGCLGLLIASVIILAVRRRQTTFQIKRQED